MEHHHAIKWANSLFRLTVGLPEGRVFGQQEMRFPGRLWISMDCVDSSGQILYRVVLFLRVWGISTCKDALSYTTRELCVLAEVVNSHFIILC